MKEYRKIINNINKETQLLESLDWDESELKRLYEYLGLHFSGDSIITPDLLLQEISNKFGESCSSTLRSMFLEVSLSYGLFVHDPNVEN